MASINKQILVGNLGKDPESKGSDPSKPFVNLSIATEDYKGKVDGKANYKTTWHSVSVFGPQAEYCLKNLKKGNTVYVEGTTEHQEHEGKWYTRILANQIVFMGPRGESSNGSNGNGNGNASQSQSASSNGSRGAARAATQQAPAPAAVAQPAVSASAPDDDDLPF
jgi:single-strand DNA-binding protein